MQFWGQSWLTKDPRPAPRMAQRNLWFFSKMHTVPGNTNFITLESKNIKSWVFLDLETLFQSKSKILSMFSAWNM